SPPRRSGGGPAPPGRAPPVGRAPAPAGGQDWLAAERASLVAVTAHAATCGWPGHAIALSAILHLYLEADRHLADAQAVFASALQAARQTGDPAAQADSLRNLGVVATMQGHYQQAADEFGSALELYRQVGDRRGQARTLNMLGNVDWYQGHLRQTADHQQQALVIFREIGEQLGESGALTNLGLLEMRLGRYELAVGYQ